MADDRTLEKTSTAGIYRRHANGCKRRGRCSCPYVVRWKAQGRSHKQMFPTLDLAREHKGSLASGKTTRRPLSSETVASYFERWIVTYRGRTSRGLEESTRHEYEISFRLHILPLPIARLRMRDLGAPDVRDWLRELERRGCSPTTIRKAKAALSVMLACAVEDGDLSSNPAAGVRYVPTEQAKRAHPKRKRRALSAADVVAILEAMPEEWRAFFTLLAQTGVRIGELCGLTWGTSTWAMTRISWSPSRSTAASAKSSRRTRAKHACRSLRRWRHGWSRCAPEWEPRRSRVPVEHGHRAQLQQHLQKGVAPGAH